ncbi:hypothetical protein [Terrarubrum flagellatum]|uniref:hypothetical protein n=1 Tax=Terrirubrum flagellatum TaxID=2895980 RepID=UPI003144E746
MPTITRRSIDVSPPNSILFISDIDGGTPPMPVRGAMILASPSGVSVACYPEQDGPTTIVIGAMNEVALAVEPLFDGTIETPNGVLMASTSELEKLMEAEGAKPRAHIRVWTNHPKWPDQIMIGVEAAL